MKHYVRRPVRRALCAFGGAAFALGAVGLPARATTCSSVAACVLGQNSGSGYGVSGVSAAGSGVFGSTAFAATSSANGKAGVTGADTTGASANAFDFGVLGTSAYGTGVAGKSTYRTGVVGTSVSGHGIDGSSTYGMGIAGTTLQRSTSTTDAKAGVAGFDYSASGAYDSGVYGLSARGFGVYGSSAAGTGILAQSHSGIALQATVDQGGSSAISASAACTTYHCVSGYAGYFKANGTALYAEGGTPFPFDSIPAVYAYQQPGAEPTIGTAASAGEAVAANGVDYGVAAQATGTNGTAYWAGPNSSYLFRGGGDLYGLGKPDTVSIDVGGNMILAGTLTQHGTPSSVVRGSDGSSSVTYGVRSAQPSIEDFGEARLAGGRAFVRIDAALGKTIDANRGYLVFITPQGATNGLYVADKSAAGFTVAETGAAHSNVAFDYRIVARAYGEASALRLARYAPLPRSFKRVVFVTGKRTLTAAAAQNTAADRGGSRP